jgi:hypothetical protein
MENSAQTPVQPQIPVEPVKKSEVPGWLWLVLVLVLGLLGGFGLRGGLEGQVVQAPAVVETTENNQVEVIEGEKTSEEVSNQVQFFTPEITKRLSFPVLTENGKISLVSTEPSDLVLAYPDEVTWGGGWLGHGVTDAVAAPDLTKTALITKTGEFRVVNSEGKLIMSAGSALKADYITAWAPDSSGVIIHVNAPTFYDSVVPMGPVPDYEIPKTAQFEPGLGVSGFYWIDLANKKFMALAPLEKSSVLEWIDRDRLLVSVMPEGTSKEIFATFNLQTFQADIAPYKPVFENLFGPQMSFGTLGKKWAVTISRNAQGGAGTDTTKIILADFPSLNGVVVDEAPFAFKQQPILSPDETKVVYQGHDEVNGPNFVYYFDGQKSEKLFEGIPQMWINDQVFMYAVFAPTHSNNLSNATAYYKYDTTTKKTTELYKATVAN